MMGDGDFNKPEFLQFGMVSLLEIDESKPKLIIPEELKDRVPPKIRPPMGFSACRIKS